MNGKRIALFFCTTLFAGALLLSGCTSESAALMEEYKEEGIAQLEEGDYEGASKSFQTALDQSFGTLGAQEIDITYYKAQALALSGDTDGALEVYTALIDYDDKNWEAHYLRGSLLLGDGKESDALDDYAEAVSLNGEDPELFLHICSSLADAGLSDEASDYLDQALAMEPSSAEDYYELGDICYSFGDYENAQYYLDQAQEMGVSEASLLLGAVYAQNGDSDKAKSMFSSYLEQHPDDADALGSLGEIAAAAGEYEEAIDYLTKAWEAAGDDVSSSVATDLVAALEYTGDFEGAYKAAGAYLDGHTDEELEREYEFLTTRVGAETE